MSLSLQNKHNQRIVFLDRDGVINRDSPEYIKSWREFEFLPRSLAALRLLNENLFQVLIITNQSAVNRRMISLRDLNHIHLKMNAAIKAAGGLIQDIFFCPHVPQDRCLCRKPKPGMLFSAQQKYRINLTAAYMVGDRAKDVECAKQAGCGCALLVQTASNEAERTLALKKIEPDFVAEDLFAAAEWIIAHRLRIENDFYAMNPMEGVSEI
jgi:D-glycero-D-manno-heptose 1,7-bisphosphate phosphatase